MAPRPPAAHAAGKVDVWAQDDYSPKGDILSDGFEYE